MPADRSTPAAAGDAAAVGTSAADDPGEAIEVVPDGDKIVVRVRGDIDAVAAPTLREALATVIDRVPGMVRVDMAAVDFLDSVGISVLVASFNRAQDAGVDFELASVPPSSRRVLEITRLTDILTILD